MRGASLIVLAWNQWPLTRRCLDSLLATAPHAAEIIVVDNGSIDGTREALAGYADRVRVVGLAQNLGFVRGMNAGIGAAAPDNDVVLLNNDLVFEQSDWLERLRDAAYADPEHGIVGARLRGPEAEGRVYHVGGFIEPDELWGQQTEAGHVERDVGQYPGLRRVQCIAFALAYLRRDVLDRIGGLDPSFHSYFEDTDYCLRAAAAGIATVVTGAVTLRHDQHGSTGGDGGFRQRLWNASRKSFAVRWQSRLREAWRGEAVWYGPTRFPHAAAHLARLMVRRLDARGLRMSHLPLTREVGHAQDFRLELAGRRRQARAADLALVAADATDYARAAATRRVGIAVSEWATLPAEWIEAANRMDRLIVPDVFQRDVLCEAGVTAPIAVLPFGVDRDYCHSEVPAPPRAAGRRVLLAVVESLHRDAPERLAQAFRAAFTVDAPVDLVIHVLPTRAAPAIVAALAPHATADARLRVLADWGLPWHQRGQLLAACDAYVSVRRGGGWDPFLADALAMGKTVLGSDFGSTGVLVREHGFAVAGVRAADPVHAQRAWFEPDFDALIDALRRAAEPVDVDLASTRARAFAEAHDVESAADAWFAELAELAALPPPRPRPAPHRPALLRQRASGQLVVLGMHRSGTSSVAGLLARMGAYVGPEDDLLRGPDNPRGHYESGRLHGACLRRLEAAGGDWKHPPDDAPSAAIDAFRRDVGALIDAFDAQRPWLMKEPRLCLVARELLPLLTRPVFVLVVRDPREVAASLAARDGLDAAAAYALWERYNGEALAASRGWPRVLVNYAALRADPVAEAARLHAALGALGVRDLALPDAETIRAWITPNAAVRRPDAVPGDAERERLYRAIVAGEWLEAGERATVPTPRVMAG